MCTDSTPNWEQQSLFPEPKLNGSGPNASGRFETSSRDGQVSPANPHRPVRFELTCTYAGVTLIKRFTLQWSWLGAVQGSVIFAAFADQLMQDVKGLVG